MIAMCTVCPDHGRKPDSSETLRAALVVGAVSALVVATYRIMTVIWPLYLTLLIAGYLWVYAAPPIRKAAHRVKHLRDSRRKQAQAQPGPYRATLAVVHEGQTRTLLTGEVPGRWVSADQVVAEITARYVAVHGQPAGELTCRAEPVQLPGRS